jgi:prepilin-type N-terminal cleavage/methylation domain-containing protein
MRRRIRGFTLMEVMLAVLVLALLSAVAVLSFGKSIQRAKAKGAVELVRYVDASARDAAKRFGRSVTILIDPVEGTMARREGKEIRYRATIELPYEIDEVRVGDRRANDLVEIACSEMGLSRSYAVHVKGPGLEKWVVVAGLSGEVTEANDDATVDAIFESLAPAQALARGDAD